MTEKIFRSILSVAVVVLLAAFVVAMGFLYNFFGNVQENQLEDELQLAATATQNMGKEYLEQINSSGLRITWIDDDGTVLYDTETDYSSMENHIDREEVYEAIETGEGSSERYSETLTEKTIYKAILLDDGTVLRISVSSISFSTLVFGMLYPIIVIIIVAVGLSLFWAYRLAKRITGPLNNLDLDNPLNNDVYEELSPLLNRIHRQRNQISVQLKDLQRQKDEFNSVTQNMKECLVLLDNNRRVLSVNAAAATLFSVNKDCIGEDFLVLDRKNDISDAIDKAFATGHSEVRIDRNGREYQFEISRIESSEKIIGAVLLAFDVTEQATAERMRKEFTANVSHELKTPLQSIMGSAELMENNLVKNEDMPRFMGHIRQESSRLVNLVEDIIRLSQLDEDVQMPREKVSLFTVATEVSANLKNVADARGISFSVKGDSGTVLGVERLLYEVVYNLCDNAVKYNFDGGSVAVNILETETETVLTVTDTGIGIPVEHQARVFERFYRVDKSHSKETGGTGLGLSIVKHAVSYHGGKLSLESGENKGTTVTIVFPKNQYADKN